MSPENLKNYVLRSSVCDEQNRAGENEEGEEDLTSNIYQKKGEECSAPIPNPLENVRH